MEGTTALVEIGTGKSQRRSRSYIFKQTNKKIKSNQNQNNKRKQHSSPAVTGPLHVKVVFMPPCCDCSRPGVFDCSVALEPHRMVGRESDQPKETQPPTHTVFINVLLLCVKPGVSHSLIYRLPPQRWHISAEITQLAAGWKSYRHWQQGFLNEQTENIQGPWACWGASGTNTGQIRASCKMTFTLLFWGCIFQFWPI